jgi:excinuclease ABC subunit C
MKDSLKKRLNAIPEKPGIYIFKDKKGIPVYIGKARSLKDRVSSYFNSTLDRKTAAIIAETSDIDFIQADSEKEALFLENNFIRQLQPKFNLRLKDDKHFPFLKLTVQEQYPGIYMTRRVEKDGAKYFGPFSPALQARRTIHLISKYFGVRTCRESVPGKRKRPCLDFDLDLCTAPCVGKIPEADYIERVHNALLFLEGKVEILLDKLALKMDEAAKSQEFEQAAHWRDLIRTLDEIKSKPQLITIQQDNKDIIGYAQKDNEAALVIFLMRNGKVQDTIRSVFHSTENRTYFLGEYLLDYYQEREDLPNRIILPFLPANKTELIKMLSSQKRKKIELIVPQRGNNKKLLEFAIRNAGILLRKSDKDPSPLLEIQNILNLKKPPFRIEGYDISNTGGEESVGSVVVFEHGLPKKGDYRKYRIKTIKGPNDVASIQEILRRRFTNIIQEQGFYPDLILIDGGKGQWSAAFQVLAELRLQKIPLVSLAKKEELLFIPGRMDGLRLERTSPALKLCQNIRDEAHRFALSYHRKKREKRSFSSPLDDIPGIGPKRKAALLSRYKHIQNIKNASTEELARIIGKKTAYRLNNALGKKGR